MKVHALTSLLSSRVPFPLVGNKYAPRKSGCYALASIYDDVIYIGESRNLSERMLQHGGSDRMKSVTEFGIARWFYFAILPESGIKSTELQMLIKFQAAEGCLPPLNRRL